jgi:hypothetical protein
VRRARPAAPLQDVSLEGVDQLVSEHVIRFAEAGGNGRTTGLTVIGY